MNTIFKKKSFKVLLVALVMAMFSVLAVFATGDAATAEAPISFVGTIWAIYPPVIAIVLALITKEV